MRKAILSLNRNKNRQNNNLNRLKPTNHKKIKKLILKTNQNNNQMRIGNRLKLRRRRLNRVLLRNNRELRLVDK